MFDRFSSKIVNILTINESTFNWLKNTPICAINLDTLYFFHVIAYTEYIYASSVTHFNEAHCRSAE